jgi:hypothetical protein
MARTSEDQEEAYELAPLCTGTVTFFLPTTRQGEGLKFRNPIAMSRISWPQAD